MKKNNLIKGAVTLIGSIYGAFVFRLRGGGFSKFSMPRPIEQALFCLPFLAIAYFSSNLCLDGWLHWLSSFLVYTASVITVLKGHGRNMDLSHHWKPNSESEPEWYEFSIKWLEGKVSEYWYDVVGIGVSGLTYTIVPGVFMAVASAFSGLPLSFTVLGVIVALSGSFKALAYVIGWSFHTFAQKHKLTEKRRAPNGVYYSGIKFLPKQFDVATEAGEGLTGFFILAFAAYALAELLLYLY